MLSATFIKQIAQSLVLHAFLLPLFCAAFCLLNVAEASAQLVDIAVTKTVSTPTVSAGGNITYIITVANNGVIQIQAPDVVHLRDPIPTNTTVVSFTQNSGPEFDCSYPLPGNTGTVACDNTGLIGAMESAQFTLIVNVNSGTEAGTVISNTATVFYNGANDPPENNQATATTTVGTATAASVSVSGRVLTAHGRGIRNALVRLVDEQGQQRLAMTSTFGYFRFADIPAGQTYTISISGKRYSFTQPAQVLNLTGDTDGINFIAEN
jgi:uncharacterized repeat protein (TIGR01451 family)